MHAEGRSPPTTVIRIVRRAQRGALARLGDAMARHRRAIVGVQWAVILVYAVLVAVPAFLPVPGFVMKLGLGEFGRSLLQGQKVPPRALTEHGFQFLHPELEPALRDLLHD